MAWVLRQPGIVCVRATIPPWHAESLRVAAKLGMAQTGTAQDADVGECWSSSGADALEGGQAGQRGAGGGDRVSWR